MAAESGFAWSNMFVTPEEDPRSEEGFADERSALVGFLRDQRLTLELKCAGLDAEQLARRAVPPSPLSLLGLIRHLAQVERGWFRRQLAGERIAPLYPGADADFLGADPDDAVVADAWESWRAEVAFAEDFVAASPGPDFVGPEGDVLRDVMIHMVEEYARHMGHADFLREQIDGRVGQ